MLSVFLKPLLAVSLALTQSPPLETKQPPAFFVNFPMVKLVDCGMSRGTAFVAAYRLISASHVTDVPCLVDDKFINQTHEPGLDFSSEPSAIKGFKINCLGYKRGETYIAVGFAFGRPVQRALTVIGTGEKAPNGMAMLWGSPTFIPGMSGGIVMNLRAEAVGIVNAFSLFYPVSFSRELKDTSLCPR